MMFKSSTYFCFALLFVALNIIPYHVKAEDPQPEAIKPIANSGGYIFINEEKIGFATFLAGQRYRMESEDEQYYHVSFGNGLLYVDKKQAEKVPFPIYSVLPKGTTTVIPKARTHILHKPVANSSSIGFLNPNIRIPVIKEVNGYYEVNFGGKKGYIAKWQTNQDNGIPVLMYHNLIVDKPLSNQAHNNMTIEYEDFNQQMNFLKKNNWKTISIEELDKWLELNLDLPDKVVAITFDDGLSSTVELSYPLLKELRFKATSFVITGKIRRSLDYWLTHDYQYVGLKEIKETTDVYNYQHHSHGMHLYNWIEKSGLYKTESHEAIKNDILKGKAQIGKAFNHDTERTKYLAYPFGHYNQTTIDAVRDAGIKLAFTTQTGNVKLQDAPYELKRQGIAPYHTLLDFTNKIQGTYK